MLVYFGCGTQSAGFGARAKTILIMANQPSLEDLQRKVHKLEEELARQHSGGAPRPSAPNDIQVVQVLDAARERLIKWVQLLLVPFAFVLAFAAFMGIRAMTDVKDSVSAITRDMEDTKNRLLDSLKNDIDAFRKELQEAQSIMGGFNVHIVTPRERELLEMNSNLFLQYIRDIVLEQNAQDKLKTIKEIAVSRDAPQPGPGYYRIYKGDDKIVLSPEFISGTEVALFELATFLLDDINPTKRLPQTEAVPAKTVDPQEAAVLKAVPCYLVESFLGHAPEIGGGCQSPEKARALFVSGGAGTPSPVGPADETVQKQGSQADEASATLCEAFRGLAKLPGMGPRLTASLLISTWIGANSRTAPASLRGRFNQELQEQATTVGDRWQHVWGNPNPKALADRIRRSAALHESQ